MFKIKNYFGELYQPHDSFVMRSPLFPVETFFNWKYEPDINAETVKEISRKSLREFYLQPVAKEALYIGSPDLHEQLLLWLDNKIEKPDKKEKTELSLLKYMIRMCTRCTPYGLFASCTAGDFSEATEILLKDRNLLQRFGRLDMDYVCQLLSHLLKRKEISDQLSHYPNSSIYPFGNTWRYIEHRFLQQAGRSYHLVQIEESFYLQKILNAAKKGSTPYELALTITNNEISFEEAQEFVYELINAQVLVSELEPNVTGEEYFFIFLNKLKSLQHTESLVVHLENVVKEFEQIKISSDTPKNELYANIVQHIKQLEAPVHLKTLIQIDSFRPALSCTLNKKINDEILLGASLVHLLTPGDTVRDFFSDFKNAFITRFESQWVPLVEILDTESGIGYGKFAVSEMEESPLIDKLPIGNRIKTANTAHQIETETFKWQLYQEAITNGKTEVVINDKTIKELLKKELFAIGLPDSIYTMLRINASSAEDIDNGNYKLSLAPPIGPSGGNLLGRFCHLHPHIKDFTSTILQNEEKHNPDCVYAEIVHLPESRTGNILMRPILRQYEIPYLCNSTLNSEYQIPITDLMVGIEENKIILRSKRLNKQVIPRMTTAHNFSTTSLPVYQFLCDLQYQQIHRIGWHWGILETRPFLPRVSYGKYILSKARWLITKEDIKEYIKKDDNELLLQISKMIKEKYLPSYVLLSQGDNELTLHLQNILCIKLLLAEINKSGMVVLTETLDTPDKCWIKSPDGSHVGEFIVAFSKNKIVKEDIQIKKNKEEASAIRRYFPVGSEWLYSKIYCGTKTAEKILCDIVKPLTEELLSKKLIDRFFFVRYNDQGKHIRIRFHHSHNKDFWKEVLDKLREALQPYIDNNTVYNLQFETYHREVERYSNDVMEESEIIFYHQSVAVLSFISMLEADEGEKYRWQVALKAIDFFLDDFGYNLLRKRDLVKMIYEGYATEFKITTAERTKISDQFRSNKQLIEQLMNDNWEGDKYMERAILFFKIYSGNYIKTVGEILSSPSIQHNPQFLNRLLSSYLHMFINRMFISNQRKVELVIFDYLLRYYDSKIAREKQEVLFYLPCQ